MKPLALIGRPFVVLGAEGRVEITGAVRGLASPGYYLTELHERGEVSLVVMPIEAMVMRAPGAPGSMLYL